MKTVKQVLLDAAEIVGQGWTQGTLYNFETNSFCARGAIMKAAGAEFYMIHPTENWPHPDYHYSWPDDQDGRSEDVSPNLILSNRVEDQASACIRECASTLGAWNDAIGRTADEVIALLITAAWNRGIERSTT